MRTMPGRSAASATSMMWYWPAAAVSRFDEPSLDVSNDSEMLPTEADAPSEADDANETARAGALARASTAARQARRGKYGFIGAPKSCTKSRACSHLQAAARSAG